jgi:hypothetical protein
LGEIGRVKVIWPPLRQHASDLTNEQETAGAGAGALIA